MKQEVEEQQDFVKEVTKMSEDFDRWYTDVVRKAELADWSGVRGMMVVRPYGWAMWEAIMRAFDDMIKESGHENWAFPLLIPREYLVKEAEHVQGFAPEVAWVTKAGGSMEELEEPLAVRPTSETIIGPLIKRYIQSHRDLPKLTNQWNSVVRWETRSRLFLRSREFWWQEGHTFHASGDEAMAEANLILGYYRSIAEDWLAVPVLAGKKSPAETFPGAVYTLTVEGLMRDGLALQMGTSHYFGQNFARAYDISFSNRENARELCHSTSWGISTRLVGALVMAHGDDSGLIVPPRVAPVQVIVVTTFDLDEYVVAAFQNGACGFLLKRSGPTLLIEAIRAARAGDALISPQLTVRLLRRVLAPPGNPGPTVVLTTRELEIVRAVAGGHTNAEIAGQLTISPGTVKTHIANVQGKLSVRNRVGIAAWAWSTGHVRP